MPTDEKLYTFSETIDQELVEETKLPIANKILDNACAYIASKFLMLRECNVRYKTDVGGFRYTVSVTLVFAVETPSLKKHT